jgi:hypothetical protein
MNIQRGRDHGIQGYIHYHDVCAKKKKRSTFDDLRSELSQEVISHDTTSS